MEGRSPGGEKAGGCTGWLWGAPPPPAMFIWLLVVTPTSTVRGSATTWVGLGLSNIKELTSC